MKKINVNQATNNQLNWLVATCEDSVLNQPELGMLRHLVGYGKYLPTTDPSQMWPIIDREEIGVVPTGDSLKWQSRIWSDINLDYQTSFGDTSLVAAARGYVISKMGEEVEVPEELL